MKNSGKAVQFAFRSLAAGTIAAIVVYSFTAYLDPTVFMPMLSVFASCQ
jgi:hypothetical protein